jgi:hypothetical protein
MELIKDKPLLRITPTAQLRAYLIEHTIQEKGTFYLNDAIVEELALDTQAESFKFAGIYPNMFAKAEDASIFKSKLEELINNRNSRFTHLNGKHIDDILFITYFYIGYSAEVYSNNQNAKYLDDLIDVFIDLLDSQQTPTDSDHIWIPDGLTGIEIEVKKEQFNEDELRLNGGFKVYSRMIPPKNVIYHFANDRPILVGTRKADKSEIRLPERLSRMLNEIIITQVIDQHKRANTTFYKELARGYIDTWQWRQRTRARDYKRENKTLVKLINEIDAYLLTNNKSSLLTDRRELTYDLLALLKLLQTPLKINRSDKALAIRTIIKDNPI